MGELQRAQSREPGESEWHRRCFRGGADYGSGRNAPDAIWPAFALLIIRGSWNDSASSPKLSVHNSVRGLIENMRVQVSVVLAILLATGIAHSQSEAAPNPEPDGRYK